MLVISLWCFGFRCKISKHLSISNHFQTVKHQKIESGDFVKGDDTIKIYTKSSLVYP